MVVTEPRDPEAILLMLVGGDGAVDIGADGATNGNLSDNFLVRTTPLWLDQGAAVAILGSPNDRSLVGERSTAANAQAIARAVDLLHARTKVPVWLVGTSAGTISAANEAARLDTGVAGLVLTSSVSEAGPIGETIFATDLAAIKVPTLIVANRGDMCRASPPEAAPRIAAALASAPRKQIIMLESTRSWSRPCEALSPHGYLGIETQAVQRIMDWIRANPPA